MIILLLSMFYPFVRIWRHRREIAGTARELPGESRMSSD